MRATKITTIVAALLAVVMVARTACAQSEAKAHVIEVSGDGQAQSPPDQATLELAIETHAPTAGEAAGTNGALAQKVRDALKGKLGDKGTMWTGGYSLYPDYNEPRPGSEAKIIGYHAQNTITVETSNLEVVGPLIDAAIAAGANRVNSLQYSLRDSTKARSEAITRASKDAQAQAQALANALGVKLGSVIKATTVAEMRPIPMMRMPAAAAMTAAAATPVEAGQITVPASVSLTYEIQ